MTDTTAADITDEIGEPVVVNHSRNEYFVPGREDVSDLPTLDGIEPIPDELK